MRSGFVYVFSNPGLTACKVDMSTRPLYMRAGELQREYGTLYPRELPAVTRSMIRPLYAGTFGPYANGRL